MGVDDVQDKMEVFVTQFLYKLNSFCLNSYRRQSLASIYKYISNFLINIFQTMQKKYGITPIRRCKPSEIELIEAKYKEIQPLLEQHRKDDIYWVNLYSQKQFHIPNEQRRQQCFKFVEDLIVELQNGKKQNINSYSFINNPKNVKNHQNFHLDVNETTTTVFIPMVHLVHENSTQFLAEKPPCEPTLNERNRYQRFATNELHLLERSQRDWLVMNQIVSKPFVILKLEPGTCHRGVKNLTNQDRPVFCINYSPEPFTNYFQPHVDSY